MFKEFKEFAVKGNMVDMAIGVVIGAAFGKIVTSLVNDVIMPPIGYLTGGIDFANLFYSLSNTSYATLQEAEEAGIATINYGIFIQTILNFLIIAVCMFLVVKTMNRLQRRQEKVEAKKAAEPSQEAVLLTEIRDLLKRS